MPNGRPSGSGTLPLASCWRSSSQHCGTIRPGTSSGAGRGFNRPAYQSKSFTPTVVVPAGRRFAGRGGCGPGVAVEPLGPAASVDGVAGAPPEAKVQTVPDLNVIKVDRPERFVLTTAQSERDRPELNVNGVISPDIDRSVPVISLASGRVVEIHAKLGDDVGPENAVCRTRECKAGDPRWRLKPKGT